MRGGTYHEQLRVQRDVGWIQPGEKEVRHYLDTSCDWPQEGNKLRIVVGN